MQALNPAGQPIQTAPLNTPGWEVVDRRDLIATDQWGKHWVVDTDNSRVVEVAADRSRIAEWGGWGGDPGQFEFPGAIAVGPGGAIFVADTWNNRIQVLEPTGLP